MTMAESTDPMGYNNHPGHHHANNNHPFIANNNVPWKQRKRKRLSALLDKLHNNNNQPTDSLPINTFESNKSSEDDDFHSNSESPTVYSISPLRLAVDESDMLRLPSSGRPSEASSSSSMDIHHLLPPGSAMPSPLFEYYLRTQYLPELLRMRYTNNNNIPLTNKSTPSDGTPTSNGWYYPPVPPQDEPLDLSMRTGHFITAGKPVQITSPPTMLMHHKPNSYSHLTVGVPVVKGDVASPTTKESVAWRYNLDVSPVVEEMPPGSDVAYVCPVCGQMFSLHDRLAKHMASRHKSRTGPSDVSKAYVCEVCNRSFARSDMLTRHMRLHTGIKPYTCKVCGQVFSRSDHLSTHQRTHTGEKPYKCPQCPYAACRRDMITRHMRTHTRMEGRANNNKIDIKIEMPVDRLSPSVMNEPLKIENHQTPSTGFDVTNQQLLANLVRFYPTVTTPSVMFPSKLCIKSEMGDVPSSTEQYPIKQETQIKMQ